MREDNFVARMRPGNMRAGLRLPLARSHLALSSQTLHSFLAVIGRYAWLRNAADKRSLHGYMEKENGEPISQPLRTLDEVYKWRPHTDNTGVASVPLRKLVLASGDRPKTLVCHDMAGGYLDDRFIQGVKHADAYRFYHWANIDGFIYFSHYLVTIPPPCWTNAAHKHRIPMLGTFITEWDHGKANCEQFLSSVNAYTNLANKLVAMATYYKFDGWLINIENIIQVDLVANLIGFVDILTQEMHRAIPGSTVLWYDSVINSGKLDWQNEVNELNRSFFDVSDGIFLNYTWNDNNLQRSRELAEQSGRPYDVYVGVDVYGRGCRGGGGFNTKEAVHTTRMHNLSVAIFGQGWAHERLDKVDFLQNENRFWQYLSPDCPCQGLLSQPLWWHCCQGCGQKMFVHGKVVQDSPWSNLSLQSVQSAMVNGVGQTEEDGPDTDQCSTSLCTDHAFQGGSCLRLSIRMPQSSEPVCYSVLESSMPQSSTDLIVSYTLKPLTHPDHYAAHLTVVSTQSDTNDPAVHRHLLPGGGESERVMGSDRNIREEYVRPLMEDEVMGILGFYSPEVGSGNWETRFYRLRVEEGATMQLRLCVRHTHGEEGSKEEVIVLLGQIQILPLTASLREVVLVTDLYCRDADHFPTKTGHVVTLVLHWTFPENCAAYFLRLAMETVEHLFENLNSRAVGAVVVATGAAIWWFQPGQKKYNPPLSPYWTLPLVGNIFQLMRMKKYSYETFCDLSKTKEYNKLFMIHLGPKPVLVLNHIDVVLEALVTKMNDFAGRPNIYTGMLMTEGGKDIMFGDYGPVWKFHRKVAYSAMKKFAFGENLERLVQNSVSKSIAEIQKKGDAAIDMRPVIMLLVFNIACGMAYGKEYDFDDPDFQQFVDLTADFIEVLGSGLPGDIHPWLQYLPSSRYNKFMTMMDLFTKFLHERHAECKENFDPSDPKSITDCMLQAQKEAEEEDKEMKDVLTDTHIMMATMDVFGAGIDTITTMLIQFIAHMIQHPDIQERVHQEIDVALGGAQLPTLSHRSKMTFTEACLCETLRLGTLLPLGVPVKTTCDTSVAGFDIPKDTMVIVNMWAIHRDPDFWSDPHSFNPDRFLDDAGNLVHKPSSYMPFSMGRRVCLGKSVAQSSLMLAIPQLMRQFRFSSPSGKEFKLEFEESGFARIPKSYEFLVAART
ncbi:hypothetical protein NP493_40g00036 [Ridgeia piscesae]|uniref:Cytosolic endo-beta-N-acetylglucosaminidase n=1 Tax=Ridgeia piscesae TaxID=27915 RepID=A0AAD9PCF8_RIDPI|nr:hypothetical protein NP493_40g00036 [Ridgeia piscesae]